MKSKNLVAEINNTSRKLYQGTPKKITGAEGFSQSALLFFNMLRKQTE